MKYEIRSFKTLSPSGTPSKIISRNVGGYFIILNYRKLNYSNSGYKQDRMLRHKENYKIDSVIITRGESLFVQVGKPLFYNGHIKIIKSIEHDSIPIDIMNTSRGMSTITKFTVSFVDDSPPLLITEEENPRKFFDKSEIEKLRMELNKKSKDIKDEECLSINEIESIVGGLEGGTKELIKYVKKKLKK